MPGQDTFFLPVDASHALLSLPASYCPLQHLRDAMILPADSAISEGILPFFPLAAQ
jgi:hypothetical protein